MIDPKVSYLSKGGNSFKKAKGICRIELKCKADALLAASIFHYGEHSIREAKEVLSAEGVVVRPPADEE